MAVQPAQQLVLGKRLNPLYLSFFWSFSCVKMRILTTNNAVMHLVDNNYCLQMLTRHCSAINSCNKSQHFVYTS